MTDITHMLTIGYRYHRDVPMIRRIEGVLKFDQDSPKNDRRSQIGVVCGANLK